MWVRLDEIFEINPKNTNSDSDICGFVPMANVDDGFSGTHSYKERKWGEVKKGYCHFQNGDIAVAKISPCFENLKSTIFHSLPNNIGAGTTELVILRGHLVYGPYFLYLFKSQWYIGKGIVYFKGVVGQQRVNRDIFTSLEVPLPPLNEQRRIVSVIQRLFAVIDIVENNSCELKYNIEATKQKVLELAITGKLVPQDPTDEPAADLLQRVNPNAVVSADTSHYGQLPDGWCYTTMNFICQLYDGEKIEDKELINLDAKYLRGKSEGNTLNKGRFVPEKMTMILVDGENSGEIFTAPINGYQGSTFKLLDINEEMNAEYVKMIIRIYQKRLRDNKVGSAIPHLNKKMFREILVPVPPIAEQTRIVERTNELMSKITELTEAL